MGISIGNYNETNLEPPRWGNANPDAVGVIVIEGIRCHENLDYGIAVSGQGMQVVGNLLEANGSGHAWSTQGWFHGGGERRY